MPPAEDACLSENLLALLVHGKTGPERTDAALRHLEACSECFEIVAQLAHESGASAARSAEEHAPEGPPLELDVSPGASIGRYIVLHCLGAGGMGIVYAAYDPELDRKVALKLLRPRIKGSLDVTREVLTRETRALARVSHPNVVVAYDVGQYGELVTMVMELVEGWTLRAWLLLKPRSVREVLSLFAEIGAGLAAAHGAGVVHRDMKPENVLIARDGRPRVTDFGLALTSAASEPHAKAAAGTLRYMAPEQLAGGRVDARTDQYAFALTLLEALVGTPPGAPRADVAVLKQRLSERAPRDVPPRVWRALRRAMAPDAPSRFPDMRALLEEIRPRPPRTTGLLVAMAAASVVASIYGVVHERRVAHEAVCKDDAAAKLVGVWDAAREESLERAFRGLSSVPFRETALRSVEASLDAYAKEWSRVRVDVCEATRVRGEQSESLLDVRMQCLDDRSRDMRFLVDALTKPTPKTVEMSVRATGELSSLESCAERRLPVAGASPAPTTPRDEDEIVARVRATVRVGDMQAARKDLDALLAKAHDLSNTRMLGEVEFLYGLANVESKELPKAEDALLEATWAAVSVGDDDLAALASLELAYIAGTLMANQTAGIRYERQAAAMLARLGTPPTLSAQLLQYRSSRVLGRGDYPEAVAIAHEALGVLESHGEGSSIPAASSWETIAIAREAQGEWEGARDAIQHCLELRERIEGVAHPHYAHSSTVLGAILEGEGRYGEAVAVYDRSLARLAETTGAASPTLAMTYNERGCTLERMGKLEEAYKDFDRSEAIGRAVYGDHPRLANYIRHKGDVERELGHPREAMLEYDRADAVLDRNKAADPYFRGVILAGRGQAELDVSHPVAAKADLEQALALYDKIAVDPLVRAEAEFALARALASLRLGPDRAHTLAAAARDAYAKRQPAYAAELRRVDGWLEKTPLAVASARAE